MEKFLENNKVCVSGEIVSGFTFDHDVFGEKFFTFALKVQRLSDNYDVIPVTVSERLADVVLDMTGQFVEIKGQFRSFNKHDGVRSKLILTVFAREFMLIDSICSINNNILIDGYICKKPVYRKTPLGREVADVLLAVNRPYGKSAYIPCVCWGRNAKFVESLEVGSRVKFSGRIQSREYQKKISETEYEARTAYEVSVSKVEVMED